MAARGRAVTSSWLMQAEGAVTPDESMMLGLGPGASVYRFRRIRFADELPMAIEHSAIAGFALAEADAVRGSPYRAGGLRQPPGARAPAVARGAVHPRAGETGVEKGAPGLFIERRGFLDDGRAVEATQSWYRGDTCDFVAELSTR